MSEIATPDEPIYPGAEMSVRDYMKAELVVDTELPGWKPENTPNPFNAKINGQKYTFECFNTRGWMFDGEYSWMSFIHHKPRDSEPEYLVPEEIGMEGFQLLYSELIKRGFHIGNRRQPTNEAFNLHERRIHAGRSIASVLKQILIEGDEGGTSTERT